MAEIVEAQEGLPLPARPIVERDRLGARHVGAKAAQEHNRRPAPVTSCGGDEITVGSCELLCPVFAAHAVLPATSSQQHPIPWLLLPPSCRSRRRLPAAALRAPRSTRR